MYMLITLLLMQSVLVKSSHPIGVHIWGDWYRVPALFVPAGATFEHDGIWVQHNNDCQMPMWYVRNTGQFGGTAGVDTDADIAQRMLDMEPNKNSITIAVIDSGINMNHEAFTGVRFLPPRNFDELNPSLDDVNGHGTAVAGVIVAMLGGAQPWYQIGSYRVFNTIGYATYSTVVQAMAAAVADGVDIINFSGGGGTSQLVEEFLAANGHVRFVFSAGNAGGSFPLCPACYHAFDHVISVSASNRIGQHTEWTNRGATVSAPGELMYVPVPDCQQYPVRLCDSARYDMLAGTSLAAPCVTAAVAGRAAIRTEPPVMTKRALMQLKLLNFADLLR